MKNPWKTLNCQVAYENAWIKVTHRNVINPSGNPGIYGIVHFKNQAVAIVPLDEDNNTWLVGQYRYTLDEYSWEVPEGGCPVHENPLETARRELLEETGITAQTWLEAGQLRLSNSVTDEKGWIFVAKNLHYGTAAPEDTEQLQLKKIPFSKAVDMVMQGEITDALSVAAILKVHFLMVNEAW